MLSSHSRIAASASTSIKPWRSFGGLYRGHSIMMMQFAVCWSAPQSQAGLLDRPHLHISALKRPTPVRSLLSLTQACRGRSDPGLLLDSEVIYSRSLLVDSCHSTDHILAIQWVFVSLGRVVDRELLYCYGCKHPEIIRRVQLRLTSTPCWGTILSPVHTQVLGQR